MSGLIVFFYLHDPGVIKNSGAYNENMKTAVKVPKLLRRVIRSNIRVIVFPSVSKIDRPQATGSSEKTDNCNNHDKFCLDPLLPPREQASCNPQREWS